MGFLEMLLLGVALSMDAFAVTISNAVAFPHEKRSRMLLMPILFGVFQAVMPVIGYLLGTIVASFIERFAGIITLVILGFIGGSMIVEGVKSLRNPEEEGDAQCKRLSVGAIVIQAISTSIDALAVGVSLLASGANLPVAATVIGVTTFVLCLVALAVGRKFGEILGNRAEIAGGVVLVLIGIKAMLP
ncbi:MAG: manganese efflux pump MntP family protein [Coriobacteriales bacterium]|jgi:putative Mn2+ efflux pump MntP